MSEPINKRIRFGLTAIKGLGEETVDVIMAERKRGGGFASLEDFAKRVPAKLINKKTLEALTFSGAFDIFGDRMAIFNSIEDLTKFAREQEEASESGQIGLFGAVEDTSVDFKLKPGKAAKEDILRWERESLGLFVSDHPLKGLDKYFEKYGHLIGKLIPEEDGGEKRTLHGLVTAVRKITTKKGKAMAILEVEDTSGKIECAIFPMVYEKIAPAAMMQDAFVRIIGKIDERNGELNCIVDEMKVGDLKNIQKMIDTEDLKPLETTKVSMRKEASGYGIYIPATVTRKTVNEIKKYLMASKTMDDTGVSIQIHIQDKVVNLPFQVQYSDQLRLAIEEGRPFEDGS